MLHIEDHSSTMSSDRNMNIPLRDPDSDVLDLRRIPRTINVSKPRPIVPSKVNKRASTSILPSSTAQSFATSSEMPQIPESSSSKTSLSNSSRRTSVGAPSLPKRNPSYKRTKPRRQSGIVCRGRRETVRNMMMLMRTDSDRRILRNTLSRKLQRNSIATSTVSSVSPPRQQQQQQQ